MTRLQKSSKFYIGIIVLVLLIVYFRTFSHSLIFLDDDTLIYTKFQGMSLSEKITTSFTSNYLDVHYYRPVTLLSLIADSVIGGRTYAIYHVTNFLLHLFTSILIFLILNKLGISNIVSFLSTLVFALSPIQINAVGWIAGRGDLLAGLFSAAALLIYIYFIKNNQTYLLIFVSVLLFLAILSKEVALLVPFLLIGLYFIEKKNFELNRSSIGILIMIACILGAYYLLRGVLLSGVHIDKFSFTTYYTNMLVLAGTISKFFIPIGIKALAGIEQFTSVSGTILLILLFILPLLFKQINKPRYYLGLSWFILLLLPGMVFRTMGQDGFYYWDCRSYLPTIGFAIMISEILKSINWQKRAIISYGLITTYLLLLTAMTIIKVRLYESPLTYWNSVKADYKSSFLPYDALFNYYDFNNEKGKAETQLVQAIELRPEVLSIRIKLFNFYEKNNLSDQTTSLLRKTLIDDRLFSDYLVLRYIDYIHKTNHNTGEVHNKLIEAYKNDQVTLEKINKIFQSKGQKF